MKHSINRNIYSVVYSIQILIKVSCHHISPAKFAFETTCMGTIIVRGFFKFKEHFCMRAHRAFDYR